MKLVGHTSVGGGMVSLNGTGCTSLIQIENIFFLIRTSWSLGWLILILLFKITKLPTQTGAPTKYNVHSNRK